MPRILFGVYSMDTIGRGGKWLCSQQFWKRKRGPRVQGQCRLRKKTLPQPNLHINPCYSLRTPTLVLIACSSSGGRVTLALPWEVLFNSGYCHCTNSLTGYTCIPMSHQDESHRGRAPSTWRWERGGRVGWYILGSLSRVLTSTRYNFELLCK